MKKNPPTKLHGLRILTVPAAVAEGFTSITTDIHAGTEAPSSPEFASTATRNAPA